MKHVIFYALGTSGDIDPMVALATELIRRDYRVSFLSNDYFKSIILAAGCEFVSVGGVEQYHKGNSKNAWKTNNHTDAFEYYHAPAFEPAFEFIRSLPSGELSFAVTLGNYNGTAAAAEKFNVPYIKIILSPNLVFSAYAPPAPMCWGIPKRFPAFLTAFMLRWNRRVKFFQFFKARHTAQYMATRKRLGCPPVYQKHSQALLQIGLFPEWYGQRPRDWPKNLELVGFALQNRRDIKSRKTFDTLVESLGVPIIFTAGTGVKDTIALFQEGKKICEALKVPGIFVGGESGAEVLQGSTQCAHMPYVDFEYALPKALAIIHHGGIGTTAQAIRAGIPQLIRPLKYDQPDNANRVYQLGLGTYVMPERFNAKDVSPIVSNLLLNAKKSKTLFNYSEDVKNSRAIIDACDLIERECIALTA